MHYCVYYIYTSNSIDKICVGRFLNWGYFSMENVKVIEDGALIINVVINTDLEAKEAVKKLLKASEKMNVIFVLTFKNKEGIYEQWNGK